LHGLPGIIGGLASIFVVLGTNLDKYGGVDGLKECLPLIGGG